jgi:hypothetical protein
MATYSCPTCGSVLSRQSNSAAGATGGLVGALLALAFASYHCAQHGKIARSQFPAEVRSQLLLNTLLLVFGAIGLLIAVVVLLVALN